MHNLRLTACFTLLSVVFIYGTVAAKPVAMFDESHGQKFLIGKESDLHLSRLAGLFRDAGYETTANDKPFSAAMLETADILIISGAFTQLTASEIDAIMTFVGKGGNVCIMLHIPHPMTGLMKKWNIYASNGIIQEPQGLAGSAQTEFYVARMEPHGITKALKRFSLHGAWALQSEAKDGGIIAKTSPDAWIDLNGNRHFDSHDARQSFGVIIAGTFGKGRYVVFGDDAIFQNKFLGEENETLAKNLIGWLKKE